MKVVIHNGARVWGGNEKWLTLVAEGLMRRGHRVVVSCRSPGPVQERLAALGVPTTKVRPGGDLDFVSAVRFGGWLSRERPDAVLLTSWNRTAWAAWAARLAGVRRVVVRLGIVRSAPRSGRVARAFRRRVDAIIANSAAVRAEWIRTAPWYPASAIHVVLNGIVPPPPGDEAERAALRDSLGLDPAVPLIAAAGNVTHRKGFDLLIDALARLPDHTPHLAIAGSGPAEAGLRQRAAALGLEPRVHWLGPRSDVPAVLRGADLFVLSSRNEGMANVMLEAMAAGVPVVATDISGVGEVLSPRESRPAAGWVVRPEDPAAIADAVAEVLADLRAGGPEARTRVAEARRRIESDFDVERMIDETERVLFPTLDDAGAGPTPRGPRP